MFDWHKKERPLQGLTGLGGGIASRFFGASSNQDVTGGDSIFEDGTYKFHVFTNPGNLVVEKINNAFTLQYLVVGGGGGSGGHWGWNGVGGAGAGGVLNSTFTINSTGTAAITVGGGGAAMPADGYYPPRTPSPQGDPGDSSVISSPWTPNIDALGGSGGGATRGGVPGPQPIPWADGLSNGASGGGGASVSKYPGAPGEGGDGGNGSPQGNAGGKAGWSPGNTGAGGGGGGAGGSGANGGSSSSGGSPPPSGWGPGAGGAGGIGVAVPWVPASYGTPGPAPGRWFGGGGGGEKGSGGGHGAGGAGGGGDGGGPVPQTIGVDGTGGGGGGANDSPVGSAGAGGPGIVIVRYSI